MVAKKFSRFWAVALLALSFVAMMSVSFDAEAQRRFGGGRSLGRQSSNVMQQRQAVKPPAAAQRNAAASGATGAAAGAKSGSRFLGPLAGIAAGLGIAALLSHFGLGGALLEFLSSFILIALAVFAVMFLLRRLRGAMPSAQAAGGNAYGGNSYNRQRSSQGEAASTQKPWQSSFPAPNTFADTAPRASTQAVDPSWFIPADFDVNAFLDTAKQQFATIQRLWDKGDVAQLREYLADDFLADLHDQIQMNQGQTDVTEIVLLNAELLGIETVAGGHLASVRYSGMMRESAGAEATHFEEVWNLYKAEGQGWLLAGIQQISDKPSH